jgi:hypothetical protein
MSCKKLWGADQAKNNDTNTWLEIECLQAGYFFFDVTALNFSFWPIRAALALKY